MKLDHKSFKITNLSFIITFLITTLFIQTFSIQPIQIKISIPQSPYTPNDIHDYNNLKMIIDNKNQYLYPTNKNVFTLPVDLKDGKHFVEIVSRLYMFPVMLIDKKSTSVGNNDLNPSGQNQAIINTPTQQTTIHILHPVNRKIIKKLAHPYIITPVDKIQYYQPQGGFSITSFLFSGTGLFLMMGVLMMVCYKQIMPKLEEAQQAPQS